MTTREDHTTSVHRLETGQWDVFCPECWWLGPFDTLADAWRAQRRHQGEPPGELGAV